MTGRARDVARLCLLFLMVGCLSSGRAAAQAMPDPSQIHGKALPAPELANGTVTVRVVKESIGNNVVGQKVSLTIGNTTRNAVTDQQGRAEFRDLPREGQVMAKATVEGEALVSDPFAVPVTGGLRVILISGMARAAERKRLADAAAAEAPPVRGVVVIGEGSQILMQFADDTLQVFYVLNVQNTARTRVDIGGPLIVDLPTGAASVRVLEGASPSTTVNGTRVTVLGPFAPGVTSVQVGYQLLYRRANLTFSQVWPAAVQGLTVGVQRVGDLRISSPQLGVVDEVPTTNGMVLLVGRNVTVGVGTPLSVQLSNLPIHSPVPRYIALGAAGAMVVAGVGLSVFRRREREMDIGQLRARREALLAELASRGDIQGTARDRRALAELEDLYATLEQLGHQESHDRGRDLTA